MAPTLKVTVDPATAFWLTGSLVMMGAATTVRSATRLVALPALPKDIELKLFTAQSEILSDTRGGIRFYPDGSSTGGRITVASGERKYLVDVDWLTGRVSITD